MILCVAVTLLRIRSFILPQIGNAKTPLTYYNGEILPLVKLNVTGVIALTKKQLDNIFCTHPLHQGGPMRLSPERVLDSSIEGLVCVSKFGQIALVP